MVREAHSRQWSYLTDPWIHTRGRWCRSFPWSFPLLECLGSGRHSTDRPTVLSCEDGTRRHPRDGRSATRNRKVEGRIPPRAPMLQVSAYLRTVPTTDPLPLVIPLSWEAAREGGGHDQERKGRSGLQVRVCTAATLSPPEMTYKGSTCQHAADGWRLSCTSRLGVRVLAPAPSDAKVRGLHPLRPGGAARSERSTVRVIGHLALAMSLLILQVIWNVCGPY